MCGIFGWAVVANRRQDRDVLVRLTDKLAHRGPDGAGYWLSETADQRHQIGLGHRRLSIIDIGGGTQPMWTADGEIGLIFNGEIYNYIELREELAGLGHRFRTESDTEVLITSYRQWGCEALKRFRGMFAFALWDVPKQQLLLARDAFGKKPLFLAEQPGVVAFASEVGSLVEFPGVDGGLNADALGHYLSNRYVPGPMTFFRGVTKLPPGCYGVWRDGNFQVTRYYTPPFAATEPSSLDFAEAAEQFAKVFDDSVRIRMRSDAPYGAYLSGGIDSSAVVGAMVRHSSSPVRTYSVGFNEAQFSELGYARMVAEHFRTDHHPLVVSPDQFIEQWPEAVRHRGAPVSEASDIPILMLSRMASKTVKMVLTGEGSDELMGGYPKHRAELWMARYQSWVPALLHHSLIAPAIRSLPYSFRRIKIAAMAAGERDLAKRTRMWFGGVSDNERDALLGGRVHNPPPDPFPYSARVGSNVRRTLFFDQTSWLPDNLLERGDRMMMAGSIEGRMPFMDTELTALVARFPDSFLLNRKVGKRVLRATMGNLLPDTILNRRKIGFRVPVNEWFCGPYRDLVRDLLASPESKVARMLNGQIVQRLVDEHIAQHQNHERLLWSLTNLEMFLREFKLA